jgi:hydrogenase maturation protein HypF
MLSSGIATTPSHAAGRLFDAIGSLLLAAPVARYEAEIAMRLEQAAKPAAKRAASAAPYPFELDAPKQENGPGSWPEPAWQIDHRPMTRAIVADLLSGVPTARIAARFHDTLVAALAETLARAAMIEPVRVVALTGGCLVNRRLADPLRAALEPSFEVIRPRHAPPGDGGISLGQAIAVAAASARGMGEPTCV